MLNWDSVHIYGTDRYIHALYWVSENCCIGTPLCQVQLENAKLYRKAEDNKISNSLCIKPREVVKEKPTEVKEDLSQVLPFSFNEDLFVRRFSKWKKLTQDEKGDNTQRRVQSFQKSSRRKLPNAQTMDPEIQE